MHERLSRAMAELPLVAILRGNRVIAPQPDDSVEGGDELVFVAPEDVEGDLKAAMHLE